MHYILESQEVSELFLSHTSVKLTLADQFVMIMREGDRALVWKNLKELLTAECFPNQAAWPDGVPAVKDITLLINEKGRGDSVIRSYKMLLYLQLAKGAEQLCFVGDDKAEKAVQLFLAYESPKTKTVETVVIVEGDEKKAKSCGSISFNKEGKKALNTYVKVVKALMGLSGISLTPMLDGDILPQLPEGSGGDVGEV